MDISVDVSDVFEQISGALTQDFGDEASDLMRLVVRPVAMCYIRLIIESVEKPQSLNDSAGKIRELLGRGDEDLENTVRGRCLFYGYTDKESQLVIYTGFAISMAVRKIEKAIIEKGPYPIWDERR